MAKKVLKCVMNSVNGENTGVFTRTKKTKNSPSPGVLLKKNCIEASYFYCDPADSGNTYYALIEPERYPGISTTMGTVYVWVDKSFIKSQTEVDDPREAKEPTPEPVIVTDPPINPGKINIQDNTGNRTVRLANGVYADTNSVSQYTDLTTEYLNTGYLWPETINGEPNYFMDYSNIISNINIIEKNLNIDINPETSSIIRNDMLNKFNRFKIAFPTLELTKTFSYVFFTRPDLNIYNGNGSTLVDKVENDPYFYYLNKNSPQLLRSLTKFFSIRHDFNPYLSNRAESFELKDEMIKTGEYGETFTGWKIKYGKHNVESKTADSFSISYTDDNNYNVYKIHKAWTDYISKVYRGEFSPNRDSITERVIDYACSVYYFICGPDGETILFWTKYTGVFPTSTPSAASSWQKGNQVKFPNFSIPYEFSWKEDMNPASLAEFNIHSEKYGNARYATTYEAKLGSTGTTFVDAPYVESIVTNTNYEFKLRFRPYR